MMGEEEEEVDVKIEGAELGHEEVKVEQDDDAGDVTSDT